MKFPRTFPRNRVISTFNKLGFKLVRITKHIHMIKTDENGDPQYLTIPNYNFIYGGTIRKICSEANISREEFLRAYYGRSYNK